MADKNVVTAQVSRSPPQPQGPMMGPMDPSAQTQGLKVQYVRFQVFILNFKTMF